MYRKYCNINCEYVVYDRRSEIALFIIYESFKEELHYSFLCKNSIFMDFQLAKVSRNDIKRRIVNEFLITLGLKILLFMSFPLYLELCKSMKMKFLHKKIYCNFSLNDSNIINIYTTIHTNEAI